MANYKIVISGYYGFNNAGDEAMLSAILQALQGTFDSPDITVISGDPKSTAASFGVHTVPRFSISGICRSIFSSDLIISGGAAGCDKLEKHDLLPFHYYPWSAVSKTGFPLFPGHRPSQVSGDSYYPEACTQPCGCYYRTG